jgi:hypothetical protein
MSSLLSLFLGKRLFQKPVLSPKEPRLRVVSETVSKRLDPAGGRGTSHDNLTDKAAQIIPASLGAVKTAIGVLFALAMLFGRCGAIAASNHVEGVMCSGDLLSAFGSKARSRLGRIPHFC